MKDINSIFYDIESLDNVFTNAAWDIKNKIMHIWYIIDTPELIALPNWQELVREHIYKKNLNFHDRIQFHDCKNLQDLELLFTMFGCCNSSMINNPNAPNALKPEWRLVCDTDPNYNPDIHPYLMGYNSYNYDTTMLALLYASSISWHTIDQKTTTMEIATPTAFILREKNDRLFSKQFKKNMPLYLAYDENDNTTNNYQADSWLYRKNMLLSGRHIDVARLNEKQSKVALKRLLGMLGFQILESSLLKPGQSHIENFQQLMELIAYNCSDVINLRSLFNHKKYQAQFELKRGLLNTYPELVYNKKTNEYKPDIRPEKVRKDRLYIDSSSAQLATKALCPYGHLKDIKTVSYVYPSEEKAKKLGIQQVNVLEETKKFFYGLYPNRPDLHAQFDIIYNFYKNIEGKNFNDTNAYKNDYFKEYQDENITDIPIEKLSNIEKAPTFLPYFDKNGDPTSGFVIFSTGGIHGAEYNKTLYDYDMEQYQQLEKDFDEAKSKYPNPIDLRNAKTITMDDGRELPYKYFLKTAKITDSAYKDIEKVKPALYKLNDKDMVKLTPKYVYTSADKANHEDFKSYYPNLLCMMQAFYNEGLKYDRYAEIFDQKETYGGLMKDKSLSEPEQENYRILREGTKLILNSASGAADAKFDNNIRVNNQIISMRIIGQLFSWRIGQAQAYEGAKITSTNTDGLYTVMEEKLNEQILNRESANIGVAIEPEPMYLISKDTNNRLELDNSLKIIGASGGSLGCRRGPNPEKALAHPAIIDWALSEYLIIASQHYKGLSLDKPLDMDIGLSILQSAQKEHRFNPIEYLTMMQNILASSTGSNAYIFGIPDNQYSNSIIEDGSLLPNAQTNLVILQHYNRAFIMKDHTPETLHLRTATERTITPAMKKKRLELRKTDPNINFDEPPAKYVLKKNGYNFDEKPEDKDLIVKKVSGIDENWCMFIQNKDLHYLTPEEYQFIIDNLDYEKYLFLLKESYENNWMNQTPKVKAV